MVVKINVSIPEKILKELDQAAREARTSRSSFLSMAVVHFIEERASEQALQRRREAAQEMDRLRKKFGSWDATAEVLKWRDRH